MWQHFFMSVTEHFSNPEISSALRQDNPAYILTNVSLWYKCVQIGKGFGWWALHTASLMCEYYWWMINMFFLHVFVQNDVPGNKPWHANMSSSEKYRCKAWRQKAKKQNNPLSKRDIVHSTGAENKPREKAVSAVSHHPDTKPSPVSSLSPISHTLSQNPPKGRKKKTENSVTSDLCPGSHPSQNSSKKDKTTPSRTQGWKRTAKESSPHDTLAGHRRWRPNPHLSSIPQGSKTLLSEPLISPVMVVAQVALLHFLLFHNNVLFVLSVSSLAEMLSSLYSAF